MPESLHPAPSAAEKVVLLPDFAEFWSTHGDLTDFTRREFRAIWDEARRYYVDLPYHNFTHAVETTATALELADQCDQHGIEVSARVLASAGLFHDANYHLEPSTVHFPSREHHSAAMYRKRIKRFDLRPAEINSGAQAILTTARGVQPHTVEGKILVRADIDNVGGNYQESFIHKTRLLRQECKDLARLHGHGFSETEFVTESVKTLASYITEDLLLGDFDKRWSRHALLNLNRLIAYAARQEGLQVPHYVQKLGSAAVQKVVEMSPFQLGSGSGSEA